MALYVRFCHELPRQDAQAEALRCELGKTLTREQRRILLRIVDLDTACCDDTAFTSFVIGFRLAAGLAAELCNERYSYAEEQERRAAKQRNETVVKDA